MRYYVVDDNESTALTLVDIVENWGIGEVIGYETEPLEAIGEILSLRPDIVLVDLLMAEMDGITLVRKIKEKRDDIYFVMISKVSDKEMIQEAYNAGIEFFINKPINMIEVQKVLNNVSEKIELQKHMGAIRSLVGGSAKAFAHEEAKPARNYIDTFLGTLGMLGERGTEDIRKVFAYMDERRCSYDKSVLEKVAAANNETARNMEQRMRRAIKKGLVNVASVAADDMSSEVVTNYAGYVFEYSTIKEEVDSLRAKAGNGGRISISKFMEGLILYNETMK